MEFENKTRVGWDEVLLFATIFVVVTILHANNENTTSYYLLGRIIEN